MALAGFRDSYTGVGFLVVGVLGAVLGLLLAHVVHSGRAPAIVLVALTLSVYFVVGSVVALRAVPGPASFIEMARQGALGWKDLLTTLPPVDGSGPLLVLPFLLGLVTVALSHTLADRARASWPPAVAMVALLVCVIVMGVSTPASVLVQGAAFGVVALAWISLRGLRTHSVTNNGSGRLTRAGLAVAIVVVAGATSVPLGTHALASDRGRVVLRDRVQPPFDIGRYPSPLAGFRRFRPPSGPGNKASRVYDKELFQVEGAPVGTPVRIATLDAYDGSVWGAANSGGSPGEIDDTFQRVSPTIRNPLAAGGGAPLEVVVTLGEGWTGVWLPTIGAVTELEFLDDTDGEEASTFRYNLATATAVVPSGTSPGDRYRLAGVVTDQQSDPGMGVSASVTVDGSILGTQADAWSEGETDPLKRLVAVAKHLKDEGGYTDGLAPFQRYGPGHSSGRLSTFVNGDQIAGNDEQFAAAMALMANRLGVPARVVLGAKLPEGGVVKGKDVHAWIELRAADGSWRTLDTDQFTAEEEPEENPPQPQTEYAGAVVPPPAPLPPPSTVGDPADGELDQAVKRRDVAGQDDDGGLLPAWLLAILRWLGPPLGVVALLLGGVLGAKARRRHRRRRATSLTARIAGGWAQVLDRARDLRIALPEQAQTRREQAVAISVPTAQELAHIADDHVFGPGEPSEEAAHEYWQHIDRLCRELAQGMGPMGRLRAAVSVSSLRGTRRTQ